MDWLSFIASLIWPLVVVFGLLLFRRPIIRLIDETQEATGPGGVSIKRLDAQLRTLRQEAQSAAARVRPPSPERTPSVLEPLRERLTDDASQGLLRYLMTSAAEQAMLAEKAVGERFKLPQPAARIDRVENGELGTPEQLLARHGFPEDLRAIKQELRALPIRAKTTGEGLTVEGVRDYFDAVETYINALNEWAERQTTA